MSLSFPSNCHYFHFICVPEFYPADCFIVIALWTVPDHCCLLVNSPIRMAMFKFVQLSTALTFHVLLPLVQVIVL